MKYLSFVHDYSTVYVNDAYAVSVAITADAAAATAQYLITVYTDTF